ncbi:hypothetical protein Tco_0618310 [Tanacetum coccineum]
MSTLMFIDLEISTQADGGQSSRVPISLPEDPYEAIRQAYLDWTDTEFEPFEDPVETETPESPHTVAPPTSLPEGTPPTLVLILRRTARMDVRVPPMMSPDLSTSMTQVAAMSDFAFRKRFRSSYESSPSSSPANLPSRKRYREDEGPTIENEDPAARGEGLVAGDEGPDMGVEIRGLDYESRGLDNEGHSVESDGLGLREEEEAVPEGQQRAVSVVGAVMSVPLGLGYGTLRRQELALEEDHVYSTFEVGQGSGSAPEYERLKRVSASRQPTLTTWTNPEDGMVYIDVLAYPPPTPPIHTPPSPEWSSGLLPISPAPSVVPSPISSPMIPLTVSSPVATPATAETKGFLTELRAQVEMQGGLIRDHTLAEERRAQLELAEIIDSMRRWQEPRGDA